jgi:PRC-barrel domain.
MISLVTLILTVSWSVAVAAPKDDAVPAGAVSGSSDRGMIVGISAEGAIGASVKSMNGEDLGELHDVIIDVDGNVDAAILSVGGFLGVGDKLVAVPYDRLFFTRDHVVFLDASREDLEKRPAYVPAENRIVVMLKERQAALPSSEVEKYLYGARLQMQLWQAKVDDYADETRQNSRQVAEQGKAEVETAWSNLQKQWQRLEDASGDAWHEAQKGYERARSEFEKAWSDAVEQERKDGQRG